MYLPDCYSMRFPTLSNYYLIDWWCDVDFRLFACWLILGFVTAIWHERNRWTGTRIDFQWAVPTSHFYVPTCQRANKRANVLTCQRRANFSTWRPNVPRRASILTWRANLPKGVPFFQLRLPNGVPIFKLFFKRIMFFFIPNKFIPNIFHIFCIF